MKIQGNITLRHYQKIEDFTQNYCVLLTAAQYRRLATATSTEALDILVNTATVTVVQLVDEISVDVKRESAQDLDLQAIAEACQDVLNLPLHMRYPAPFKWTKDSKTFFIRVNRVGDDLRVEISHDNLDRDWELVMSRAPLLNKYCRARLLHALREVETLCSETA